MQRDTQLLALRPNIPNAQFNDAMGAEEHFQNKTLRPIIKLQNDLLLAAFKQYIVKGKNTYYTLSTEKRSAYIAQALNKDIKFRNTIKGMVLGQFTLAEYKTYLKISSALNKRIMHLVTKRLQDQLQYFDDNTLLDQ